MIGKLELVTMMVSDMERSVAFYRDVLGLDVEYESPAWSQLAAGNISIGLHASPERTTPNTEGSISLGFYVDDAEQAVEELRSRGAEIAQEATPEEFGGSLAIVRDPDGYPIQLLAGWPSTRG
jgi:catechol 2,3-dioxygenase-like lactoylglutathione lyase family enzyme